MSAFPASPLSASSRYKVTGDFSHPHTIHLPLSPLSILKSLVTPRNTDVVPTLYFLCCFVYLGYRGVSKTGHLRFSREYIAEQAAVLKTRTSKKVKKSIALQSEVKREVRKTPDVTRDVKNCPGIPFFPRCFPPVLFFCFCLRVRDF